MLIEQSLLTSSAAVPTASSAPPELSVVCKNCFVKGSLDVKETTPEATPDSPVEDALNTILVGSIDAVKAIENFFENGTLELDLKGFAAQLELQVTLNGAQIGKNSTAPLPDIPIGFLGVQAGVGEVGLLLQPNVIFGFQIKTSLSFSFGFNLTIPDSTIIIDVGNITDSSLTGFDTNFQALPFEAEVDNISLTVFAAFKPTLAVAIKPNQALQDVLSADIEAGFYMDVPALSATIEQVSDVDANCTVLDDSKASKANKANTFKFPTLTHITSNIIFDTGFEDEATIKLPGIRKWGHNHTEYQFYNKTSSLPTACYSFDAAKKAFVTPTASGKAGSNSKDGPGGQKNSAFAVRGGHTATFSIAVFLVISAVMV